MALAHPHIPASIFGISGGVYLSRDCPRIACGVRCWHHQSSHCMCARRTRNEHATPASRIQKINRESRREPHTHTHTRNNKSPPRLHTLKDLAFVARTRTPNARTRAAYVVDVKSQPAKCARWARTRRVVSTNVCSARSFTIVPYLCLYLGRPTHTRTHQTPFLHARMRMCSFKCAVKSGGVIKKGTHIRAQPPCPSHT